MTDLDELRARQEALEIANGELHEAFRQVDGDAHEALIVAKTNIKLMIALRTTQLEHGRVLGGLVTDVAGLKTHGAALDSKVAALDSKVAALDSKIDTVDAKVEGLTTAVIGLQDSLSEVLRRLPRPDDNRE